MFRIFFLLLVSCIFQRPLLAQDHAIDARAAAIPAAHVTSVEALANYIKQQFVTDSARLRAIYVWVAHHISYDLAQLKAREKAPGGPPQTVADVLATRSAVCQGYADLFVALCKEVGIQAEVVGGYTRQDGKVSSIPHAWVAALLQGEWFFFDPTWGAGYVKDNRFVPSFNNAFYKVSPERFIADHMPFDPLYQLLPKPLNHKEFIEGRPAGQTTVFHYRDSLRHHAQLTADAQMAAELRRLQAAGIQNDLLVERAQYLKTVLQGLSSKDSFDEGVKAFTASLDRYKEYIAHKNKQFTTIDDAALKEMMNGMEQQAKQARALLLSAEAKTDSQRQAKTGNIANIDRFWAQLNKEKEFTTQYFAADAAGRKQLFARR